MIENNRQNNRKSTDQYGTLYVILCCELYS